MAVCLQSFFSTGLLNENIFETAFVLVLDIYTTYLYNEMYIF